MNGYRKVMRMWMTRARRAESDLRSSAALLASERVLSATASDNLRLVTSSRDKAVNDAREESRSIRDENAALKKKLAEAVDLRELLTLRTENAALKAGMRGGATPLPTGPSEEEKALRRENDRLNEGRIVAERLCLALGWKLPDEPPESGPWNPNAVRVQPVDPRPIQNAQGWRWQTDASFYDSCHISNLPGIVFSEAADIRRQLAEARNSDASIRAKAAELLAAVNADEDSRRRVANAKDAIR